MHLHDLSRPAAVLEIYHSARTRHERSQQPRAGRAWLDARVYACARNDWCDV
jgi:hypothetical protein